MRLLELGLERYGAFSARSITFDAERGLAVVFGPNEIGKSTLLSGVTDFLFGIPMHSPHGEVFGYDVMRLNAHLRLADGAELKLKRRKGKIKTLSDDKGTSHDQDILSRALGATSRERFLELFGLDHATLRAGGEGLLTADGELGRLIVEAGGGLRGMVARLGELELYGDGLFAPRKSDKRAFYQALGKVEAADRMVKASATSKEAYLEARSGHVDALARYRALIEEAHGLGKRRSELERLVRVQPLLAQLAQAEEALEGFGDLAHLPTGFDAELDRARAKLEAADQELERAANAAKRLEARRNELCVDPAWSKHRDRIVAVSETAIAVRQARQSLVNRRRELVDIDAKLAALRGLLGLAPTFDLATIAPSNADLKAVRDLHTEAVNRRADAAATARASASLAQELSILKETIDAARAAGRDRPFGVDAADLTALPQAQSAAAAQGKRLSKAADELAQDIRRLGFRDLEHMRALTFPDLDTLRGEIEARQRLARDIEAHTSRADEARASGAAAHAAVLRLASGAAVASPEAIGDARNVRDQALAPLIASHRAGIADAPLARREQEIASVVGANAEADDLADRRTDDAHRVAALVQQREREEDAKLAQRAAAEGISRLTAQGAANERTFARAYPDATAFEPDPGKLLTLAIERARLIDRANDLQVSLAEADARLSDLEPKRQALALAESQLGAATAGNKSLVERVKTAVAAIKAHDVEHANFVRDGRDIATKEAQRTQSQAALEGHTRAETAWSASWSEAVAALGLKREVSLDEAEQVMREWATARGELSTAAQTRRRIEQIEADVKALAEDVASCAGELGVTLASDPVEAAADLKRRSDQNEQQSAAFAELAPELNAAKEDVARANHTLSEAKRLMEVLNKKLGMDGDGATDDTSARLNRRDQIQAKLAELHGKISIAGDEILLADLRRACIERDIDSLRADLSALDLERQHHEEAVKAAVESMKEFETALRSYEDPTQVNQAIAERECATSDIHTITQRWIETIVAHDLLTEAIARVRAEHQDPLIARAGALFKLTTQGAFVGIEADVDANGKPVVIGRRSDGRAVGVSKMSDGTRDQLFLAFRLASIEQYGKAGEPIPFIADDILVHFDDARAAATLELLAEFSKTNQVILFTHHQSVRDAAAALSHPAVQVIDLDEASNAIGESEAA